MKNNNFIWSCLCFVCVYVMKHWCIQVPSKAWGNLATQVLASLEHPLLPTGTQSVVNRCMHESKYTPHQDRHLKLWAHASVCRRDFKHTWSGINIPLKNPSSLCSTLCSSNKHLSAISAFIIFNWREESQEHHLHPALTFSHKPELYLESNHKQQNRLQAENKQRLLSL